MRTAPSNHRTFNGERVAYFLRIDTTLQHDSNRDGHGTCDATAPRGEVSQLSLTSHHLTSRGKAAVQADRNADMLAFVSLALP